MGGPHRDGAETEGKRGMKATRPLGIPRRRDEQRQRHGQAIIEETEQKGLRESEWQREHRAPRHTAVRRTGQ